MFAVCGVETAEMFHCASTSPTSSSFCLRSAVSTSQRRIRRGKKKSNFFFLFPSTIYDGALLNIFPPPTPYSTLREVAPQHRGFAPPLPSEPMQIKAQIPIDLGAGNRRYDRKPPRHLLLHRPHRPQPKLHVYD